jgi:uncharacterized membrane protein
MKNRFKVKPAGIKVLLWGLVFLIAMNLLGRFGWLPMITSMQSDVLTLISALFIATEIGVMGMIRNKKGWSLMSILGTAIIALAVLGVVLGWFGVTIAFLQASKTFIDLGLLIFVLVELFR